MIARLLTLPERRPGAVIACIGCLFALAYTTSHVMRPKPSGRVITGDALHHYVQLRSAVFDHDLHFRNEYVRLYGLRGGEVGTEWLYEDTPTGHVRNLMPVGPAILWSPLYLLVAVGAWITQAIGGTYPLDGYGRAFQATAGLSGVAAATVGVWLTFLAASRVCSRRAAIWSTLTLWLSSSAVYYSVISPTYSHAASMLATSGFWLAWLAVRSPRRRYAALGAMAGVAALMRWQDAILLVPVFLDLVMTWRRGELRLHETVAAGALAVAAAALAFSPQMVVWWVIYGQPLALPQGEGFMRWTEPALASVLFSDFHGLFSWTPVVALAALGTAGLWRRSRPLAVGIFAFLALSWYVNAAVADWWAGEAFGSRRFLSCFPAFAFGLSVVAERWQASLTRLAVVATLLIGYTFLLLVQYQAFMHGLRDIVPYPSGFYDLYVARFVVWTDILRSLAR